MQRTRPVKISHSTRREMVLRKLAGESAEKLAEEYGVAVSGIYRAASRALAHPERDLAEARAELAYWEKVSEIRENSLH